MGGGFRNIYAPWAVQEAKGWRFFYSAWDGVPTGNDRVYSTTTNDFIDFGARETVIEHGVLVHVSNVNVQKLEDGSYQMICTGWPDPQRTNKPIYFSSPDGRIWNGSPQPYPAQMKDFVRMEGYDPYEKGDLNGANVLLTGPRQVLPVLQQLARRRHPLLGRRGNTGRLQVWRSFAEDLSRGERRREIHRGRQALVLDGPPQEGRRGTGRQRFLEALV